MAKALRQGWIKDLPMAKYHWAEPYTRCLNKSKLEKLAISPAHCHAVKEEEPTKAMRVGTILNDILLLKTSREVLRAAYKDDEVDLAVEMARSFLNHKNASKILTAAETELTGIYKDPDFGFWGNTWKTEIGLAFDRTIFGLKRWFSGYTVK